MFGMVSCAGKPSKLRRCLFVNVLSETDAGNISLKRSWLNDSHLPFPGQVVLFESINFGHTYLGRRSDSRGFVPWSGETGWKPILHCGEDFNLFNRPRARLRVVKRLRNCVMASAIYQ
jgi:hypothetical protein